MKTRADAVAFIEKQFDFDDYKGTVTGRPKGNQHHYGKQELRELMDFIYGGVPSGKSEEIEK